MHPDNPVLAMLTGVRPRLVACREHFDPDLSWDDSADLNCHECRLLAAYYLDKNASIDAERGIAQIEALLARTANEPDRFPDNQELDLDE